MDPVSATDSLLFCLRLTRRVLKSLDSQPQNASGSRARLRQGLSHTAELLAELQARLEGAEYDDIWYNNVSILFIPDEGPADQYEQALDEFRRAFIDVRGTSTMSRIRIAVRSRIESSKEAELNLRILATVDHLCGLLQTALSSGSSTVGAILQSRVDAYAAKQVNILKTAQRGSGDWFFNSLEFRKWLDSSKHTLFCCGPPGTGKTVISAMVIGYLTHTVRTDNVGVAYLFCDYTVRLCEGEFLAAISKQLVRGRPSSMKQLEELYNRPATGGKELTIDDIYRPLQAIMGEFTSVFIVVDALDECHDPDRLVSALRQLQRESDVRLMFTSRAEVNICRQFADDTTLKIIPDEVDFRLYVDGMMSSLPKFVQHDSRLKHEIRDTVSKAAGDSFLLAQLYMKSLRVIKTPRAMAEAIARLSGVTTNTAYSVHEAYESALQRIYDQDRRHCALALATLAWIIHSKRPLKVEELHHALAMTPDVARPVGSENEDVPVMESMEEIISYCSGLVTFGEELGIVRLVHLSALEYLQGKQEQWFPRAREVLASTCLMHLMRSELQSGPCEDDDSLNKRRAKHPFLQYAAQYWSNHLKDANGDVDDQACQFLRCEKAVQSVVQMSAPPQLSDTFSGPKASKATALHLLAMLGLERLSDKLYLGKMTSSVLEASEPGGQTKVITPLMIAVTCGKMEFVRRLIKKGANVNNANEDNFTALHAAANGPFEEILCYLLDNGAEVNKASARYGTALYMATSQGHEGIVRVLLEHRANVDTRGGQHCTALQVALYGGHGRVASLLIDHEADVDVQGGQLGNALQAAAYSGLDDIARRILSKGVDINASGGKFGNALQAAIARAHHETVSFLLEEGADVSHAHNGFSPLSLATVRQKPSIVHSLLAAGASFELSLEELRSLKGINWQSFLLTEALRYAAAGGEHEMAQKLIAAGADVDESSEPDFQTPLQVAAMSGYAHIITLLLIANANPHKTDQLGRTVYDYADLAPSAIKTEEVKRALEVFIYPMKLALFFVVSGGRTKVERLDIGRHMTDEMMFSQILRIYQSARRKGWWHYSLKGFRGVSFVEGATTSFGGFSLVTTKDWKPQSHHLYNGHPVLYHSIRDPSSCHAGERIWTMILWTELFAQPDHEKSLVGILFLEGWLLWRIRMAVVLSLLLAGLIGILWATMLKRTEAGFAITGCLIAAEAVLIGLLAAESQMQSSIAR